MIREYDVIKPSNAEELRAALVRVLGVGAIECAVVSHELETEHSVLLRFDAITFPRNPDNPDDLLTVSGNVEEIVGDAALPMGYGVLSAEKAPSDGESHKSRVRLKVAEVSDDDAPRH